MATSQLDVCNVALSHLGVATEIQSMTERTKEAGACRRLYAQVVAETLRDFPWPWATVYGALALVEEEPNSEWAYAYRMPSDCVRFARILSGARLDSAASRIPFKLSQDSQGALILCDVSDAEAEWTTNATNPALWPSDFAQCVALLMAGYLAPRVTKGDDFKLGDRALRLYQWKRDLAWSNAAQEFSADLSDNSSFMGARDANESVAVRSLISASSAQADETDSDAVVA